jgi:poly(hydroxyalkanoate) depolymerase family esterase
MHRYRFCHPSVWLAILLIGFSAGAGAGGAPGAPTEVADFGANPGQLRMFRYIPDGLRDPAPLVVVLHGCKQTAAPYAEASGWMQYADRWGFALLLPEQRPANNRWRCFNWFRPENAARDRGEALSIRRMIARMQADYPIDPHRIYVAGLSAGGAMTAALLAAYPEVFAGGAILAGVPYGCASGLVGAWWCLRRGRDREPAVWAAAVRQATGAAVPNGARRPRISLWQGDADRVVNPANARALLKQWTEVLGIDRTPDREATVHGHRHRMYQDAGGTVLVETYTIAGMGHGAPVAPGAAEEECGRAADYVLPVGICASYHIGRFWGLDPP